MRQFILTLALLCLAVAASADPPRLLRGVLGEVVQVTVTGWAECGVTCPVRLCLNAAEGGVSGGFSLGSEARPTTGCRDLAPVLQRVTFWSRQGGALRPVLGVSLDLRDKAGAVIWAEWLHPPDLE